VKTKEKGLLRKKLPLRSKTLEEALQMIANDAGVIIMDELKSENIYLYNYLSNNKHRWEDFSTIIIKGKSHGFPYREREQLGYIRWETSFWKYVRVTYNRKFLEENGVKFTYDHITSDEELIEEILEQHLNGATTSRYPKKLKSKIEYRARKAGLSFKGYIVDLIGEDIFDKSRKDNSVRKAVDKSQCKSDTPYQNGKSQRS